MFFIYVTVRFLNFHRENSFFLFLNNKVRFQQSESVNEQFFHTLYNLFLQLTLSSEK